jgi:GrpB-like predicted nucleotidyltransferase (UPF0157 family)
MATNFNKYLFKEYDLGYKKLFQLEKRRLRKILPEEIMIEHIGSTAIKGVGGKGIVDVIIGVQKKDLAKIRILLQKKGYFLDNSPLRKRRIFFQKNYLYSKRLRRVHLHLVLIGSKEWKWPIKTVEILGKDKILRNKYIQIKKEGSLLETGDGKKYRAYKKKFLDELEKKVSK